MDNLQFSEKVRQIIYEELPRIIQEQPEVRFVIWNMLSDRFADRQKTDERFERMFEKLKENDRKFEQIFRKLEENDRKFEQIFRKLEENDRKFEQIFEKLKENDRKFEQIFKKLEENDRKFEQMMKKLEEHDKRFEEHEKRFDQVDNKIARTIGALGARWGVASEQAFREALKDALERLSGHKVFRYQTKDEEGIVLGRPDQVEIDVVVSNGEVWLFELKSGVSKADVFHFKKKAEFYEKREGRKPSRLIIISPIPVPQALEAAKYLGIEIYYSPEAMEKGEQVQSAW